MLISVIQIPARGARSMFRTLISRSINMLIPVDSICWKLKTICQFFLTVFVYSAALHFQRRPAVYLGQFCHLKFGYINNWNLIYSRIYSFYSSMSNPITRRIVTRTVFILGCDTVTITINGNAIYLCILIQIYVKDE